MRKAQRIPSSIAVRPPHVYLLFFSPEPQVHPVHKSLTRWFPRLFQIQRTRVTWAEPNNSNSIPGPRANGTCRPDRLLGRPGPSRRCRFEQPPSRPAFPCLIPSRGRDIAEKITLLQLTAVCCSGCFLLFPLTQSAGFKVGTPRRVKHRIRLHSAMHAPYQCSLCMREDGDGSSNHARSFDLQSHCWRGRASPPIQPRRVLLP